MSQQQQQGKWSFIAGKAKSVPILFFWRKLLKLDEYLRIMTVPQFLLKFNEIKQFENWSLINILWTLDVLDEKDIFLWYCFEDYTWKYSSLLGVFAMFENFTLFLYFFICWINRISDAAYFFRALLFHWLLPKNGQFCK